MDSLMTAQILRDAQQFYSDSFQDLLSIFLALVAIIAGWKIWDSYQFDKRVKKFARKEAWKIKDEMQGYFDDFKVYVKIALAITKFRDDGPTKKNLEILVSQNCEKMSEETVCALVYAIRYCIENIGDIDMYLAKRVYDFVVPLSKRLNTKGHNVIYGALANQILMRVKDIIEKSSTEDFL